MIPRRKCKKLFATYLVQETTSRHFEWDHSDRMRVFRTQVEGSQPSLHVHYLYDAAGQRVKKLVRSQSGQVEAMVYIGGIFEHHRRIHGAETQDNNSVHVMDDQKRIALVRVGTAFPENASPAVQYHLGDHLGSSNLIVDDMAAWINREEYTPYGETSFGSFPHKRYRFTSQERDEESGLSYHSARYYAPWLGRWVSCDPLGTVDGLNLYQYVQGCPMGKVDFLGTQSSRSATEPSDSIHINVNPIGGAGGPGETLDSLTESQKKEAGDPKYWSEEIVVEAPAWYREQFEPGGPGYDLALGVLFGPARPTNELDKLAVGVMGVNLLPFLLFALEALPVAGIAAAESGGSGLLIGQVATAGGIGSELVLVGGALEVTAVHTLAVAASGALAMAAYQGLDLRSYGGSGGGQGHHVPAKGLFKDDPDYDPSDALAVAKDMLETYHLHHPNITRAQTFLYRDFAKTGKDLTWEVVRRIETDALVAQGLPRSVARATVDKAIAYLQSMGVKGPTRNPFAP